MNSSQVAANGAIHGDGHFLTRAFCTPLPRLPARTLSCPRSRVLLATLFLAAADEVIPWIASTLAIGANLVQPLRLL